MRIDLAWDTNRMDLRRQSFWESGSSGDPKVANEAEPMVLA